jgi:hypothetical protein
LRGEGRPLSGAVGNLFGCQCSLEEQPVLVKLCRNFSSFVRGAFSTYAHLLPQSDELAAERLAALLV